MVGLDGPQPISHPNYVCMLICVCTCVCECACEYVFTLLVLFLKEEKNPTISGEGEI